jgi:hypothetical protein
MREAMSLGAEPAAYWERPVAWSGVRIGGGRAWRDGHSGKS